LCITNLGTATRIFTGKFREKFVFHQYFHRETKKLKSVHEYGNILKNGKYQGRKPDKNLSLSRLELMTDIII
jgi:hypothetical protein